MSDASATDERHAGEPAVPPRPKRLPGLWLICFLLGMGGMAFVQGILLATPLGMVCFGAMAVVCFGGAVGLWSRSNAVRRALMVLLGLLSLLCIVGFALDPLEDGTWCVLPLGFALVAAVALRFRRPYFLVPPEQKPRLRSVLAYVTAGVVPVLTVPVILIMMIDDAPREFPLMELADLTVPDEENGFLVLQTMADEMPPWPDEETELFFELTNSDDAEDPAEWYARAGDVVADWEPWLARIDDVLARPGFEPPAYGNIIELGVGSTEWLAPTREVARRLVMASDVYLHEDRLPDAMETAVKVVELGARVSERSNCLIAHLVGIALVHIGAEQVVKVAGTEGATVDLLHPQIDRLAVGERLKDGAARGFVQEFHTFVDVIPMIKQPGVLSSLSGEAVAEDSMGRRLWAALVRDAVPFLKYNMTRNVQGEVMSESIGLLEEHVPRESEYRQGPAGITYVTDDMDGWHLVRNPLGDILVSMLVPATERSAEEYHRAAARLQMTQLALAIRCYHLEHDALPAMLEVLVPEYLDEMPIDPFARMPFDYRADADTPALHSLGPDGVPNDPDDPRDYEDDITIELTFAAEGADG